MCWGFGISEIPYFRNYPTWIRITVGGNIEGCKFVYEIKAMFNSLTHVLIPDQVQCLEHVYNGKISFFNHGIAKKTQENGCSFCRQFSRKASTRQETSWSYYLGLADVRILILLDQRKFFSSFSTKHFLPFNENDYNFCYRIKRRIKKVYEYSLQKSPSFQAIMKIIKYLLNLQKATTLSIEIIFFFFLEWAL